MNTQAEIKAQIALIKVEEKRLKSIQKIKDKNSAFNARMMKEYEKSPVDMIVWILRLNCKANYQVNTGDFTLQSLLIQLRNLNFTFEKVIKRNRPDQYNLLNLEQGKELLYILEKEHLIPELEAKYAELNPFTQLNCCVCLMDKCETEMAKMRKKVDDIWVNGCACNTDICGECIKLIGNKCPTCRSPFTAFTWVK
jgi:hypothetical protein